MFVPDSDRLFLAVRAGAGQGAAIWVYRPHAHKNEHRGKPRAIAIGPKGRAVLDRFTPTDPADYYFSPRRAVEALHAERAVGTRT